MEEGPPTSAPSAASSSLPVPRAAASVKANLLASPSAVMHPLPISPADAPNPFSDEGEQGKHARGNDDDEHADEEGADHAKQAEWESIASAAPATDAHAEPSLTSTMAGLSLPPPGAAVSSEEDASSARVLLSPSQAQAPLPLPIRAAADPSSLSASFAGFMHSHTLLRDAPPRVERQVPQPTLAAAVAVVGETARPAGATTNNSNNSTPTPTPTPTPDDSDCVVRLRNVHKTYLLGVEGVAALRGVTADIRSGEFVVILGKSGGGKTSLLNVLGTVDKPTRGDLTLCGVRVDSKTPDSVLAEIRLRKLGFVFQTFNLLPGLTAIENVELPMVLAAGGKGKGEGEGNKKAAPQEENEEDEKVASASRADRRRRAEHLLRKVGMGDRLTHVPGQMSGGEQQRVTIARALANEPSLLLLDEPTGDLDSVNTEIVMSLLTSLNRDERVTCVLVTHDVSLKYYAHRVFHMLDGKLARVEEIPDFVRKDALEALEGKPSVHAWRVVQRREAEEEEAKERERARLGGPMGRLGGLVQGLVGLASSAVEAGQSLFARARGYTPSEEADGGRSPTANTPARRSAGGGDGGGVELAGVPATSSSSSSSDGNPPSTSTGLVGVAAISHAMYVGEFGGDTAHASSSSSSSSSHHRTGPVKTVVRGPETYATHIFAEKAKARAVVEEAERKEREREKEAKLRRRVEEAAAARNRGKGGEQRGMSSSSGGTATVGNVGAAAALGAVHVEVRA